MRYSRLPLPEKEYLEVVKNYYVPHSEWRKMTPGEKHLALCFCVARRRKNFILTGISACILLGIAVLDRIELRPHAICLTRRRTEFICWHYKKTVAEVKTINGLLVENPLSTIINMALSVTSESLLVSINDCLYKGLFSAEEFVTELKTHAGMNGKMLLERLIGFASAKCESPLETIAWIEIYKAGFVLPEQQVRIGIESGKSFRVDMYWELGGRRIVLELDGRVKYDNGQALFDEKIREDKLRAKGYEVFRCVWDSVQNGDLIQMIENAGIPQRRNYGKKFPA